MRNIRDRKRHRKRPGRNLKFKIALWRENNKEIRAKLDGLSKVKDLKMPTTKRERNYLNEMNLTNPHIWLRYRCK